MLASVLLSPKVTGWWNHWQLCWKCFSDLLKACLLPINSDIGGINFNFLQKNCAEVAFKTSLLAYHRAPTRNTAVMPQDMKRSSRGSDWPICFLKLLLQVFCDTRNKSRLSINKAVGTHRSHPVLKHSAANKRWLCASSTSAVFCTKANFRLRVEPGNSRARSQKNSEWRCFFFFFLWHDT